MKAKNLQHLILLGIFSYCLSFSSLAAEKEISSVKVSVSPTEDILPGKMAHGQIPQVEKDANYVVSYYKTSNAVQNPKTKYDYTIKLSATDGYTFTLTPSVTIDGAFQGEIVQNTRNDILVRASVYPFTRLPNPENLNNRYQLSEYTWNHVPFATGYEVTVFYGEYDKDGKYSEKSETVKTKEARMNILPYMVYSDKVEISVKAIYDEDTDAAKYILPSDAVYTDESYKKDKSDYKISAPSITLSLKDNKNGKYAVTPKTDDENEKKETKPSGGMPETGIETKWVGSGDNWQYTVNGDVVINRWFCTPDGNWYYARDNGIVASGLQNIDGKWYYFSSLHDGTFGILQSGYINVYGVERYFHPLHDGHFGEMYQNSPTPNGKVADAFGVLR